MFRFLSTFLFLCSISLHSVLCFCIYNQHSDSTVVDVFQTYGQRSFTPDSSRFRAHDLAPGNKQCCHFSNQDCNGNRRPDSILQFGVRRTYPNRREKIFDMDCPAGGYIVFKGDANNPDIAVFNADGSRYNFSFTWRSPDRQFSAHHHKNNATVSSNRLHGNNTEHVNKQT